MNVHSSHPLAGRYVLVDQIGAGGMGSVWRAWDLRTSTFLAAKLLTQTDGGMLLRFVREQSVRIQHPHVVAPSGWAAEDNVVIFTMDLVRGGSVHTLLGDHGLLPLSYTMVVLDQTLQALAAVHEAGVVHRDVKPANLLLEATGTGRPYVRLGDFGVAALMDDVRLTMHPGAIGTEGYMAPEQRLGAPPTPQQDLYALGIVGIQMLTGLGPRQQQGVPPGPLHDWLSWLTATEPENRPVSAVAALQALRQLGVPTGTPWLQDPEPPEVFDQLNDVAPPAVPSGAGSAPGSGGSGLTHFGTRPLSGTPSGGSNAPGPYAASGPSGQPVATPAHRSPATLIAALLCFLGAIGLALAAVLLLL
ncbi:serine/threonine-protein kinase [Nocardioides daejeonensis]|uniref:serine/threonine-protein kinase n=1 Tax=Nocardioides daejeonensis TaxID=1046556 RepID=UPI000D74EC40|nr:serine/threonine-protein kinase [Nocardioides daejeonensis]